MSRHEPGSRRRPRRGRRLVAAIAVLAVGGGTAVAISTGLLDLAMVRGRPGAAPRCPQTVVRVAASPTIAPAVRSVLAPMQGRTLPDGTCLRVDVQGADADQVIATTRGTDPAKLVTALPRLPHLWVPDSSIWVARAGRAVPLAKEASLAASPVVLSTSEATTRALGWAGNPPTWAQAVTTGWPVSVDLTTDTNGLATAFALRASLGETAAYRRALAALSLSVAQGNTVGLRAPLDLVSENSSQAPILPSSEQAVLTRRHGGLTPLTMVYPKDGSPCLDYPLVRVAAGLWGAATESLVTSVAAELTSSGAGSTYAAQGFRLADGAAPDVSGVRTGPIQMIPMPGARAVSKVIATLTTLAAPTRMLALIDVSSSMNAQARPGVSRIDFVRNAASTALRTLPPDTSVGAWTFASKVQDDLDYEELAPVDRLDARAGGTTHRAVVLERLKELPDKTRGGGTSIYDTVDAAVTKMQAEYDGRASNVVLLLTDGTNQDRTGLTLRELIDRLKQDRSGRAIRIIAIGISDQADMDALRRIAEASPGGEAYPARDPVDLAAVLVDAVASRG